MAGPLILLEATPRAPATGQPVTFRFAGGGGETAYPAGYKGGIVGLPNFVAALDFEEDRYGTGGVATASVIEWAGSRNALADAAGQIWQDAPVTLRIGAETAVPPIALQGTVMQATVREGRLQIALADPAVGLKKPFLRDRFAGTGGLEGPVAWEGRIKPRIFGRVWNVAGAPIDAPNNIYCFADPLCRLRRFAAVRDKGAATAALAELPWQGTATATLAALQAADAPQGGGIACPSIACVKWWTQPAGELTADVEGEEAGGYVETTAAIAARVVAAAGGPGFATGTIATADQLRPAPVGLAVMQEGTTTAEILDALLGDVSLLWVLNAQSQIDIRQWAWTASTRRVRAHAIERSRTFRPLASRRTGYRRNQTPMDRNGLAAIVLVQDLEVPPEQFLNSEQQWRDIRDGDGTKPEDGATRGAKTERWPAPPPVTWIEGSIYIDAEKQQFRFEQARLTFGGAPLTFGAEEIEGPAYVGIRDEAIINDLFSLTVTPPKEQTIYTDYLGNEIANQFPRTLTVSVLRGAAEIRTSDSVRFEVEGFNVAATVNNKRGSPDKGKITVSGGGAGSLVIGVIADGTPLGPYRTTFSRQKAEKPQTGGAGARSASEPILTSISDAQSFAAIAGPLTLTVAEGETIALSAIATYACSSQQAEASGRAETKWQLKPVGTDDWADGTVVFGSLARKNHENYSFRDRYQEVSASLDGFDNLGEFSNAVTFGPLAASDYEARLVARIDARTGAASLDVFDGTSYAQVTT